MKINNEFTVSVPVQQAWDVMLDLQKIAPCLPGAAIQEEKGDGEYDGTMKVKIGPITANYKGTVKIEEADEENHRAVLQATGRDARGQGTASATIVSTLQEESSDSTKVSVETDMKLTGRAAQFGRGIAQDVATKMLTQFAECLEREISGGAAETGGRRAGLRERSRRGRDRGIGRRDGLPGGDRRVQRHRWARDQQRGPNRHGGRAGRGRRRLGRRGGRGDRRDRRGGLQAARAAQPSSETRGVRPRRRGPGGGHQAARARARGDRGAGRPDLVVPTQEVRAAQNGTKPGALSGFGVPNSELRF